jgi:hypothetical protein
MHKQGWRLISSTSAAVNPVDVYVWMFFERDVIDHPHRPS